MSARRTEVSPIVEADIVATIDHWFELIGAAMTGDGGRLVMRNEFFRQLQASDAASRIVSRPPWRWPPIARELQGAP